MSKEKLGVLSPKMIMVKKLFVRDKSKVSVDLETANILSPVEGKRALSTWYRACLSVNSVTSNRGGIRIE